LNSTIHGERMGIPIEFVERLESLSDSAREYVGGLEVMQYRRQIVRVVRFENLLTERRAIQRDLNEQALEIGKFSAAEVREQSGTPVIVELGRILGIVKAESANFTPPSRPALPGALVIQERIAELFDMEKILARVAHPEISTEELEPAGAPDGL
jgi:two-component system chemotaxis sensor kinase CheA